jgi:hypothetical protein
MRTVCCLGVRLLLLVALLASSASASYAPINVALHAQVAPSGDKVVGSVITTDGTVRHQLLQKKRLYRIVLCRCCVVAEVITAVIVLLKLFYNSISLVFCYCHVIYIAVMHQA